MSVVDEAIEFLANPGGYECKNRQIDEHEPGGEREKESDLREESWSGGELTVDFKAGQMLLSHDQDSNAFYLQAYEREADDQAEEESPRNDAPGDIESVGFWITTAQAGVLGEEALKICAAGRPTCFLCGQPINPDGHACPRANGHTVLEAG
ncbi:MAG: DUF3090 family protein [Gemmatimonadetes bacterium]|nr:DUF3090 family protein [Gemmatimonadota bacterium]